MAGSTIDHLIATTIFIAALLIFISLFNQTIQTAILYQRNKAIATKCSDLLDNMLLNPGYPLEYDEGGNPIEWGKLNCTPTIFGLQDPEFTQYRLSPFSLMRLRSAVGDPIYYYKTDLWYSNITMGFGNFLLVSFDKVLNYSYVAQLLGINGTYGFRLTVTPIINVSISKLHSNPLTFSISVKGGDFPINNATVSYCLLRVEPGGGEEAYPAFTVDYGVNYTDIKGLATLSFPTIDETQDSYALIVYASSCGLRGVGYYEHILDQGKYAIPLISDFSENGCEIILAHSWDIRGGDSAEIKYNATLLLLTEDFTFRSIPLDDDEASGHLNSGEGQPYASITIPFHSPSILVITYSKSATETGIILMPWGINAMAFPVVFGGSPSEATWVATDIRNVLVGDIAYRVKLELWSLEGYEVRG